MAHEHLTCPRHGTLLYGLRCVGCDCYLAGIADGGPIPSEWTAPNVLFNSPPCREFARVVGFDLASEKDFGATVHMRASKDYQFTVEEVEFHEPGPSPEMEELLRLRREQIEAVIFGKAMHGDRWEHARDSRSRPEHWGTPPHRQPVEVITDPDDQRGVNARRVGPPQC